MFNIPHYSPFNRSYQFMHLQNSAYHLKNKKGVKPIVKTNLKRSNQSLLSDNINRPLSARIQRYDSPQPINNNGLSKSNSKGFQASFNESHRVIHKNEIVERAKSARINRQNSKIVQKLIKAQCMVTEKSKADSFYSQHKKYKSLRRKYQQNGQRNMIPLGNIKLLNPTLASFKTTHPYQSKRMINSSLNSYNQWVN